MRARVVLVPILALVLGATARADAPAVVRGADLVAGGPLAHREAEVVGRGEPSRTPFLVVEAPGITSDVFAVTGTVAYEGVEGESFLEMWAHFADGSRYFSRTLADAGPLAKLAGTSPPRPFSLPFQLEPGGARPERLELAVVLAGPGRVRIRDLALVDGPAPAAPGAWWSEATAGWIGGIAGSALGLLGAAIGTMVSLGVARGPVLACLRAMAALGAAALAAGAAALALGQPYAVWFPLALTGGIAAALGVGLRRSVRRRDEPVAAGPGAASAG